MALANSPTDAELAESVKSAAELLNRRIEEARNSLRRQWMELEIAVQSAREAGLSVDGFDFASPIAPHECLQHAQRVVTVTRTVTL